jgi:hypothetical protein
MPMGSFFIINNRVGLLRSVSLRYPLPLKPVNIPFLPAEFNTDQKDLTLSVAVRDGITLLFYLLQSRLRIFGSFLHSTTNTLSFRKTRRSHRPRHDETSGRISNPSEAKEQ